MGARTSRHALNPRIRISVAVDLWEGLPWCTRGINAQRTVEACRSLAITESLNERFALEAFPIVNDGVAIESRAGRPRTPPMEPTGHNKP
jgi:hypothetical protein